MQVAINVSKQLPPLAPPSNRTAMHFCPSRSLPSEIPCMICVSKCIRQQAWQKWWRQASARNSLAGCGHAQTGHSAGGWGQAGGGGGGRPAPLGPGALLLLEAAGTGGGRGLICASASSC